VADVDSGSQTQNLSVNLNRPGEQQSRRQLRTWGGQSGLGYIDVGKGVVAGKTGKKANGHKNEPKRGLEAVRGPCVHTLPISVFLKKKRYPEKKGGWGLD